MKKGYVLLGLGVLGIAGYLLYKNKPKKVAQTVQPPVVEEEPEKQGLTIARPALENESFKEKMENMSGKPEVRGVDVVRPPFSNFTTMVRDDYGRRFVDYVDPDAYQDMYATRRRPRHHAHH